MFRVSDQRSVAYAPECVEGLFSEVPYEGADSEVSREFTRLINIR
jgi:hypothetical protein